MMIGELSEEAYQQNITTPRKWRRDVDTQESSKADRNS
jgi:hypothetical protein